VARTDLLVTVFWANGHLQPALVVRSPSSSFVVPSFALGVTAVILSVAVLIIIILIFLEVRRRSRLGA
jgi:hypothetical protein